MELQDFAYFLTPLQITVLVLLQKQQHRPVTFCLCWRFMVLHMLKHHMWVASCGVETSCRPSCTAALCKLNEMPGSQNHQFVQA